MPRITPTNPDAAVMSGFPADGDVHEDSPPAPREPNPSSDPPADPPPDRVAALQARLDAQAEEIAQLRRNTPPPAPKDPMPPPADDDGIDWDQEFFTSPKKALERHAEIIERRVTKRLTSEYQRDRSTQAFWDKFYDKHQDLKPDHDLVDITLKRHLAEMGTLPVDKAIDRLADLTRDRILRYSGGTKPRAPKPRVEGATPGGSPPKPSAPPEDKILSITDLIKQRKENRRKAAGA